MLHLLLFFKHPLFRTLQRQHKGDQYRKCFKTNPAHGPRQPWHDIHSAVRGPEAIHLVKAFEERWKKQANSADLVPLSVLGFDNEVSLENEGGWCTQLSRSIDSRVNEFDQSAPVQETNEFVGEGLVSWTPVQEKNAKLSKRFETATMSRLSRSCYLDLKKGRLVDSSIHTTNIHQIRRAEHEPFAVYILLPMWMEGIPAADATQGLLYFQRVTIEAMYKQVQDALTARMANSSDYGLEVSDYLNIYCLGTRETSHGSQATEESITEDEKVLDITRRHQIYIHSKMMIVDDDVVQIGTANINQRSMDGCRDSEIMMTAWQPDHLATSKSIAKSDIHAYRMHIWASITGEMHEAFRNPSSHVGGKIHPRKGLVDGNFTDTKASVLGKKSLMLPELLLT